MDRTPKAWIDPRIEPGRCGRSAIRESPKIVHAIAIAFSAGRRNQ